MKQPVFYDTEINLDVKCSKEAATRIFRELELARSMGILGGGVHPEGITVSIYNVFVKDSLVILDATMTAILGLVHRVTKNEIISLSFGMTYAQKMEEPDG